MKTTKNTSWFKLIAASGALVIVLILAFITTPSLNKSPNKMERLGLRQKFNRDLMLESAPAMAPSFMTGGDGRMLDKSLDTYAVNDSASRFYGAPTAGQTAAEADPRVIKTADLNISVDGVAEQTQAVTDLAGSQGGFVQSSTVSENPDGSKSGYVTVRVPADKFEETVDAIKDLAVRVDKESINGQDVTEQYTDLEARLRSAKAQEEQYLEILDQATSVQDILSVQSYLQSIRYEIESFQGQLNAIGNQTDYSTINVQLEEDVRVQVPTAKFDLGRDLKLALNAVVALAQASLSFLVYFVIVGGAMIIPVGLFIALVVWVVKKMIVRL